MAPQNHSGLGTIRLDLNRSGLQQNPFLALPKLLSWIRDKRWFMDKEATIAGVEQADAVALLPGPDPAVYGLFVRFRLAAIPERRIAERQKCYFIPIILSSAVIAGVSTEDMVRLELTDGILYLALAEHSKLYQELWFRHLAAASVLVTQRGKIRFQQLHTPLSGSALPPGALAAVQALNVSSSNVLTLIKSGAAEWISKTYKDLRGPSGEPGRNWPPNYEAMRYEALALAGYPNIPQLYGLVFYENADGAIAALSAVMEAVPQEGEIGSIFWNSLDRYINAWEANQQIQEPAFHQQHLQGVAAAAREIAGTIARMHLQFSDSPGKNFRPVAASADDLQRWSEAPLRDVEAALQSLHQRYADSPDSALAVLIQKLERLSWHATGSDANEQQGELEKVALVIREQGQGLQKFQIHGDLHTAQGLIAAKPGAHILDHLFDAVERGDTAAIEAAAREIAAQVRWIDFEGVPAKNLVAEADDGRDSPFLDLAGIAQALCYIVHIRLYQQLGLNPQERADDRGKARRTSLALTGAITLEEAAVPGLTAALIELLNGWLSEATSAFLDGYLEEAEPRGLGWSTPATWNRRRTETLIYLWILARAAHELRYETYAREWGWEAIPGGRILQILRTRKLAVETGTDFVQVDLPDRAFFSPVDAARLVDGIFLPLHHIRSREDWGIGDFATAKKAIDFSRAMGFHFIQFLPVTYSAAFHSPYSVASSRALDPEYASVTAVLTWLQAAGIQALDAHAFIEAHAADLDELRRSDHIDHERITQLKLDGLRLIWDVLRQQPDSPPYREFQAFLDRHQDWLSDHMLYLELKKEFLERNPATGWDWRTWDRFEPGLAAREPAALERARQRHAEDILFASFVQFVLDRQLQELVEYGRSNQVFLMLDMPFSPPDADIWIDPERVGLKRENGYQRSETQGVPAKKENPVGQNWQFTAYDWSHPGAIEFFLELFRITQERAVYVRVDHVLGLYRLYMFRQDVKETLTLERLGLYAPIQVVRRRALEENTDEAKNRAVWEVSQLIEKTLADPASELPRDVIRALFDETGRVRRGGNMIAVARKVPLEKYGEQLPADSVWQRWEQAEDLIFENQPLWDYIRLSPNERAQDQGFLWQYLFPDNDIPGPLPTDSLRPAYYRLSPGEKILAALMHLAQECGTILILETLGTVPDEIDNSTCRLAGYNYIPVIWGLDRSSRYHPTRFIRNAYATFSVADSESLQATWLGLQPEVKWPLLREFFPGVPDHELAWHADSLTPEVHEKLLSMVYAPREIYPEIAPENVPLMTVIGLHDAAGYSDEYRLNRPGEAGQWVIRFPDEVAIEHLLTSALGGISTPKATQVVELFRKLQEARKRRVAPVDAGAVRLLRVRPDVEKKVMQIREIGQDGRAKPFYVEASVQGQPAKVELVVTDSEGDETRFAMQPVQFESGGVSGVTWWGAALEPRRVGNYTFRVEIASVDGTIEASKAGYLFTVPEGADLNPLSPDYFLKGVLRAIPA